MVIHTPLLESIHGGNIEGAEERLVRMQPMRRLGTPQDIANMALFLASEESAYVTGAAMVVDGGYTAR